MYMLVTFCHQGCTCCFFMSFVGNVTQQHEGLQPCKLLKLGVIASRFGGGWLAMPVTVWHAIAYLEVHAVADFSLRKDLLYRRSCAMHRGNEYHCNVIPIWLELGIVQPNVISARHVYIRDHFALVFGSALFFII